MEHLFFDGAFGTYYLSLTEDDGMCEIANINNPGLVKKIHNEYISAGATLIKTNTFCANSLTLGDKFAEVISAAFSIAAEAANGKEVTVFADIGNIDAEDASLRYTEVARCFINEGAKNYLFETLCDFEPIADAISLIRKSVPDATVAVSFAVKQDGYTKTGRHYLDILSTAAKYADIVGLNCLCGPSRMTELLKAVPELPVPLLAMPNSGYPSMSNSRLVYRDNPSYFASKISELATVGVKYLGGCCGTTPEHIRLAVCAVNASENYGTSESTILPDSSLPTTDSKIKAMFEGGHKPIFIELDPPLTADARAFSTAASIYLSCGADVITVPDSPFARTRADSVMMAAKASRETSLPVLPHITCRDKNSIAMQGTLLAASIEGINDLLLISGDPIPASAGRSENVFSFNSIRLTEYVAKQNETTFSASPFHIAAALNTNAQNFDVELDRAKKKLAAGTKYFLTQAIFSDDGIQRVQKATETLNCPVVAGIMPLGSYKNALFLNNEVHGFHLPDELMERITNTDDFDREIISFCCETAQKLSEFCGGFYIIPQLRRTDLAAAVIKYIKENVK